MHRKRSPSQPREVVCVICGATFETCHSQGKLCSQSCRDEGARKNWRDYRHRNPTSRKDVSRNNYEKNKSKVLARVKEYRKTDAGKNATRKSYQNQEERFPERLAARQAVLIAVRNGSLIKKPCEHCGAVKVHGHHVDYSKPLDVIWLCEPCHRKEHQRLRSIEDGLVVADLQEVANG